MNITDRFYTVYKHTSPSNKVYIGITSLKPEDRWKAGYKSCPAFYNAIKKYGWDNFEHEILFSNLTKEEACKKEIELIAQHQSTDAKFGYNISFGGSAPLLGLSVSSDTKKKLSEKNKAKWVDKDYHDAHSGANAYWYGKSLSDETKEKIRLNHKDLSGERHPFYGKTHTKESREKMSKSKIGKYIGCDSPHAKSVYQIDKNDNIVAEYGCIKDACEATGAYGGNITKVLNGERKFAAGFKWKYKEVC